MQRYNVGGTLREEKAGNLSNIQPEQKRRWPDQISNILHTENQQINRSKMMEGGVRKSFEQN